MSSQSALNPNTSRDDGMQCPECKCTHCDWTKIAPYAVDTLYHAGVVKVWECTRCSKTVEVGHRWISDTLTEITNDYVLDSSTWSFVISDEVACHAVPQGESNVE